MNGTIVTANRELLLVAIRNLHENAARHMPEPGIVRWSMNRDDGTLAVYVDDEGPGIPEDEIPLVTNRFFRGRNKSALGSGLGLSIVDLALAHQWRMPGAAKSNRCKRPARTDRLADRKRK